MKCGLNSAVRLSAVVKWNSTVDSVKQNMNCASYVAVLVGNSCSCLVS